MKTALLICAALCVVYIYAENCPNNNVATECTHMTCTDGYFKDCVQGVCTCTTINAAYCTHQFNCTSNSNLPNCNRGWHCVDNACRCGGFWG